MDSDWTFPTRELKLLVQILNHNDFIGKYVWFRQQCRSWENPQKKCSHIIICTFKGQYFQTLLRVRSHRFNLNNLTFFTWIIIPNLENPNHRYYSLKRWSYLKDFPLKIFLLSKNLSKLFSFFIVLFQQVLCCQSF